MRRHGGGRAGGEGEMELILLALAGAGAAVLVVRAAARQEGLLPASVNALLGLGALLLVNVTAPYTGVRLGFNLFNGVAAGVLGVPGVVLLLLVQWTLT